MIKRLGQRIDAWLDQWLDNMSCKKFARHVASDVPLPGGLYARFHFWLHWCICPFCRRYWAEIRMLGETQRSAMALRHHPTLQLPEIKQRLKERLVRHPA